MQAPTFETILEQILAKDARFHRDAYLFLREALDYTQKLISRDAPSPGGRSTAPTPGPSPATEPELKKSDVRHVTGQQLLGGIREYAVQQFGPMATTVFEEWGVRSCQDFGEIVFNMVEHTLLAKTENDSRADFREGYDFYEAFRKPFLPSARNSADVLQPKPAKA